MSAAYPAAWAAHAFDEFFWYARDATVACFDQLGIFDPADPFVASELCNIFPELSGSFVTKQGLRKISRQFVNCAVRKLGF